MVTPATPEQVVRARQEYCRDPDRDIEVDDNAMASATADGVWVQAWVWLANED